MRRRREFLYRRSSIRIPLPRLKLAQTSHVEVLIWLFSARGTICTSGSCRSSHSRSIVAVRPVVVLDVAVVVSVTSSGSRSISVEVSV